MDSNANKKKIIVAVSGGFDPVHTGHVSLFEKAKKLGDELVVIVNNDNWLKKKKGYVFMSENERAEIIRAFRAVDGVIITSHKEDDEDVSVCRELEILKPDIFVNAGDRTKENIPEVPACEKINCKMVFGICPAGKNQSSSWLLQRFFETMKKIGN